MSNYPHRTTDNEAAGHDSHADDTWTDPGRVPLSEKHADQSTPQDYEHPSEADTGDKHEEPTAVHEADAESSGSTSFSDNAYGSSAGTASEHLPDRTEETADSARTDESAGTDETADSTARAETQPDTVSTETSEKGADSVDAHTVAPGQAEQDDTDERLYTAGQSPAAEQVSAPVTESAAAAESEPEPETGTAAAPQPPTTTSDTPAPLFEQADLDRLRTEWREIQGDFVDNPHDAVTKADELVMNTIQQLSALLAERKKTLEDQWPRHGNGDTETLRQALRGYRAFFNQLLSGR